MSNESNFHLNGFANKPNLHYWTRENYIYTSVCCTATKLLWFGLYGVKYGPYFLRTKMALGHQVNMSTCRKTLLLKKYTFPKIIKKSGFQENGSISYTARISMADVCQLFTNLIISSNGDISRIP